MGDASHGPRSAVVGVALGLLFSLVPTFLGGSCQAYSFHQGELVLTGSTVRTIEGEFGINGSIFVRENATLVLKNARLNFTQNYNGQFTLVLESPAQGHPRLIIENSTIATSKFYLPFRLWGNGSLSARGMTDLDGRIYIEFRSNSTGILEAASVDAIYAHDFSRVVLSDVSAGRVWCLGSSLIDATDLLVTEYALAGGSSKMTLKNSQVKDYCQISMEGVNTTISCLVPGSYDLWDLGSVLCPQPSSGSRVPDLVLIRTSVNGWYLHFSQRSNSTVADCKLVSLRADESKIRVTNTIVKRYVLGFAEAELITVNSTFAGVQLGDVSQMRSYWFLKVCTVDSANRSVSSATVTVTHPNGTKQIASTGPQGCILFLLPGGMMNATGAYPLGNYLVEASDGSFTARETASMTSSKNLVLALRPQPIEEGWLLALVGGLGMFLWLSSRTAGGEDAYSRKASSRARPE